MKKELILSVDQGTSSTKTVVFNIHGQPVIKSNIPLESIYLDGGLVEQNPREILKSVLNSVRDCYEQLTDAGYTVADIATCAITNQRETFVLWDADGNPLHNAIVWQCKRSVELCARMKAAGQEAMINEKTGLLIDPYFSATKVMRLLENAPSLRERVRNGEVYFGTIDTWILFALTDGKQYLTDHTNASRTLLFNLNTLSWDRDLIEAMGLTGLHLPAIQPSASYYGQTDFGGVLPAPIPVNAMIGDSHAAAFGEKCHRPGVAKATLGTGSSIMMNIGNQPKASNNGMVTTVCWSMEGRVDYALEGVIVTCGATLEWLKNALGILPDTKLSEEMAYSVPDHNGVYLIPAFSGLGAPYWDMSRKASVTGLTFDCNKNHVVRAALESIVFQIKDVIAAIESDSAISLKELRANGGISTNRFVMQSLADLLNTPVVSPDFPEISALGAALLAGLNAGLFNDLSELRSFNTGKSAYLPKKNNLSICQTYSGWLQTITQQA